MKLIRYMETVKRLHSGGVCSTEQINDSMCFVLYATI